MQVCKTCEIEQPFENFNIRKDNSTGYNIHCKSCMTVLRKKHYNPVTRRKWYDLNKEHVLQQGKEWRENNRERHSQMSHEWYVRTKTENTAKYMHKHAKARAKKKGIPFEIEVSDIVIPEYCPYLGVKLQVSFNSDARHSPSLDRIDPKKGYTKDNIQVVSRIFNSMKWDSSREELIHFCKSVLEKEGILPC
jgi:hypothetical protein